jgi:hypothetical protein
MSGGHMAMVLGSRPPGGGAPHVPFGSAALAVDLYAHYSFEGAEALGTTSAFYSFDSVGGEHLTDVIPPASTKLNQAASGKIGKGLKKTGPGPVQYPLQRLTTGFRQSGDFSVALWFRRGAIIPFTTSDLLKVWDGVSDTDYRIRLDAGSSALTSETYDAVFGSNSHSKSIAAGAGDYYLTLTYSATTRRMTIYINGGSPTTDGSPLLTGLRQTSTRVDVGARVGTDATFPGLLFDELTLWNRQLTAGDVSYMYNAGAGRAY